MENAENRRTLGRRAFLGAAALTVAGAAVGTQWAMATGGPSPLPGPRPGQRRLGDDADEIALTQPYDPGLGVLPPAPDAPENGMFGPLLDWPVVPLSATLLADGRLLTFGTPVNVVAQNGITFDTWDASLGDGPGSHSQTACLHGYDSFCNGIQSMGDGRYSMVGGRTQESAIVYDPSTGNQIAAPGLSQPRWYPSVLRLHDDRILVMGGTISDNITAYWTPWDNSLVGITPEIGTGGGPWSQLTGATSTLAFGAGFNHWWYPRTFLDTDGTIVGVSGRQLWRLDPRGDGSVGDLGEVPGNIGVSGTAVMYQPGRLMLAGGGQMMNSDYAPANNAVTIVDVTSRQPVARSTNPMFHSRNWHNATIMADGQVVVTGGTSVGINGDSAVRTAEIWNPDTERFRTVASAQRIRTYHSTALLLPSGAVFTGGGGVPGPENNFNAEIYYPPYFFEHDGAGRVQWAPRSSIQSIRGSLEWGSEVTLTVSGPRPIVSGALITSPNVTHSHGTDQRRVPLNLTVDGSTVSFALPGIDLAPPGGYLLTLIDTAGVPTPSQLITLGNGGPGMVTVYGAAHAVGSDHH